MQLDDADIAAFQKLFEEETGRSLTKEEAQEYAEKLIRLAHLMQRMGS